MKYVAIIGRNTEISIAELESVFGSKYILPVSNQAVLVASNSIDSLTHRLGGTVKIAKILIEVKSSNWNYLTSFVNKNASLLVDFFPDEKASVGISTFDIDTSPGKINALGLTIKKIAKQYNKSLRIVPNKSNALNSAQIIHNKLLGDRGFEFIFVAKKRGGCIIAQTVFEQNIDEYSARDQARPNRDSKVGMLPPKLAQTIINLATANSSEVSSVLDPFCGTGVLLQESMIMGYKTYGSDLEPRMVEFSKKNIEWLVNNFTVDGQLKNIKAADATSNQWPDLDSSVVIACETYLGRPLNSLPDSNTLQKIINDCDTIHQKFLKNVASQTKQGFRMCIAVPAWRTKQGFIHLKALDHPEKLGYNRISFVHVDTKSLIYHRSDQTVARELVVLERI